MTRLTAALFNDTRPGGHFGCDFVISRIHALFDAVGIDILWTWPVGKDWRPAREELLARPRPDLVIVNGEGSIHHSARSERAAFLPQLSTFARDDLGVPSFLINATLFELDPATLRNIGNFDGRYVRDDDSAQILREVGIPVSVVPDLTLSDPATKLLGGYERKGVAADGSVRAPVREAIKATAKARGWPYASILHKDKLSETLAGAGSVRALNEHDWLNKRYRVFLRHLLRREAVVTGRFHCVTLALATRTPFVAVQSNTPKIQSLLTDVFGNASRLVDVSAIAALDFVTISFTDAELEAIDAFEMTAQLSAQLMAWEIKKKALVTKSVS